MSEAGDGCRAGEVTAAFELWDRRDECGMAGRWMGVWLEIVGEEASGSSWRLFQGSRLTQGLRLARAQGSRELSSLAADARKVGLGRAEVGGAGSVGTGHLGLLQNGYLPGPTQLLGARACPGDCDRLRPTARTGPGLWGSSSRFRWTLGSEHPGPGPGYLPTQHLSLLESKWVWVWVWVWTGSGPVDVW